MKTDAGRAPSGRLPSLDGLRGVAALVVVFHHCMLSARVMHEHSATWLSWEWIATFTPVHLLWAGSEAVVVFFVLSGFVLAAQVDRAAFTWRGYFAGRLPRLYLPAWGSLLFAAVLVLAVHRQATDPRASNWLTDQAAQSAGRAVKDAFLLLGTGTLNGPLWSLQWEVLFSLLLPAYVLVGRTLGRSSSGLLVAVAGLLAAEAIAPFLHLEILRHMPIFGFGILLYVRRDLVAASARRITSGAAWCVVVCSSLLLLMTDLAVEWFSNPALELVACARVGAVLGACGLVFAALHWTPLVRGLSGSAVQWLGGRSFSLYLTHNAIVVTLAFAFGLYRQPLLLAAVAVPLSLLVAEVFYRICEKPSHRLSKQIGKRLGRGRSIDLREPAVGSRRGAHLKVPNA